MRNPLTRIKALRASAKVHAVIDQIIERHQPQPPQDRPTLLNLLLEGQVDKRSGQRRCPLNHLAARNEAIVMFMAGHETTANSLAWSWHSQCRSNS